MNPRLLAPLALLALGACATGPTLDERLGGYVGRSELELVQTLGVPMRSYEAGGQKFLQYEDRRVVALPGGFAGGGPYLGRYGGFYGGYGGFGTTYAPVQCDVTFGLQGGRVAGFTHRGQGCS